MDGRVTRARGGHVALGVCGAIRRDRRRAADDLHRPLAVKGTLGWLTDGDMTASEAARRLGYCPNPRSTAHSSGSWASPRGRSGELAGARTSRAPPPCERPHGEHPLWIGQVLCRTTPTRPRRPPPMRTPGPGSAGTSSGSARCKPTTVCSRDLAYLSAGASALTWRAQQAQGILDALLEHLVGEPLVREGAGHLERPDHEGEDTERLHAC